jgi:hypothetical protein
LSFAKRRRRCSLRCRNDEASEAEEAVANFYYWSSGDLRCAFSDSDIFVGRKIERRFFMLMIASRRNFQVAITIALGFFAPGCFLAIPAAIQYYQSTREYVATAEVGVSAESVYRTALKEAAARSATIKTVKRDDSARLLEITDGKQTASVKAVPLSSDRTEIVVVADVLCGSSVFWLTASASNMK